MTNRERKQLVENAIRDYNIAKQSEDADKIARSINEMENVFICVNPFSVNGIEKLRQTILKAKTDAPPLKTYNDFESANEAADKAVKENPGRMIFIMNKNGRFAVVVGWDGRDEATRNGWRFSNN